MHEERRKFVGTMRQFKCIYYHREPNGKIIKISIQNIEKTETFIKKQQELMTSNVRESEETTQVLSTETITKKGYKITAEYEGDG